MERILMSCLYFTKFSELLVVMCHVIIVSLSKESSSVALSWLIFQLLRQSEKIWISKLFLSFNLMQTVHSLQSRMNSIGRTHHSSCTLDPFYKIVIFFCWLILYECLNKFVLFYEMSWQSWKLRHSKKWTPFLISIKAT